MATSELDTWAEQMPDKSRKPAAAPHASAGGKTSGMVNAGCRVMLKRRLKPGLHGVNIQAGSGNRGRQNILWVCLFRLPLVTESLLKGRVAGDEDSIRE
jgi:hypothetical protein